MSRIIKRTSCPKCPSSDGFHHYDDGHSYCFVCKHYDKGTSNVSYESKPQAKQDITLYKSLPIRALTHKPISQQVCEKYGVRVGVDETTGEINKVFYPYHKNGKVTSFKVRSLPKDFYSVGDSKNNELFGQHLFSGGKFLIVTEGEDDTLAVAEMLAQKGKSYSVVSIQSGAQDEDENGSVTVKADLSRQLEYFMKFETVLLFFDNDKQGKVYAKAVAEMIVSHVKEVKIVELDPQYGKDAGDLLVNGHIKAFSDAMNNAKKFSPDQIENGKDMLLDELLKPAKKGVYVPFMPKTMDKLKGFREGEMTLLMAPPGVGKTTICRGITHAFLAEGHRTFNIVLEEDGTKTRQGILAYDVGVPLNKFRSDPSRVERAKLESSYELLGNLELYTTRKVTDNDTLFNKLNYFAKVLGCKYGIIDPIGYVVSGRDAKEGERRELDKLLVQLAGMVETLKLHLIIVAHVNRKNRKDRPQTSEEKYPYWERLEMDDARGSGAFEATCWNIIGLEPERVDPALVSGGRGRIRTNILKNREWSWLGIADYMVMDEGTGRVVSIEPEEY